jgi:transcriptional regulator with XRE-family HTH domain
MLQRRSEQRDEFSPLYMRTTRRGPRDHRTSRARGEVLTLNVRAFDAVTSTQCFVSKAFSSQACSLAYRRNPLCKALRVTHMSATSAHPFNSSESFGRRLRRERERRQIALTSIAENSKISVSLLRDLERDDVSKWPPGIFRRSFMRAYAQAVGLDVEATMREFLERFPDPDPDGLNPPQPPKPASPLRLTLATDTSFARGRILAAVRVRCLAIACDAAVMVTLGLALGLVLKTVWMPLCVVMVGYYAGGILLLGNTPGVRLCAPRRHSKSPSGGTGTWRRIWSSAPQSLRSRFEAAGPCEIAIGEVGAESQHVRA